MPHPIRSVHVRIEAGAPNLMGKKHLSIMTKEKMEIEGKNLQFTPEFDSLLHR